MKKITLPRLLSWLFTVLFYGQLLAYTLFVGFLAYVWLTGLPETAKLNMTAHLNGVIVGPATDSINSKALQNWQQASTFALNLDVPNSLSHRPSSTSSLWMNISLNGPVNLSKLSALLWVSGASILLTVLLVITLSYLFMRLFQHVANNQIFDHAQVTRLIRIGQCMLVYTVFVLAAKWLAEQGAIVYLKQYGYRLSQPDMYNLDISAPSLEGLVALMGLCVLALAQVFRRGVQLQQESELTI